MSNILGRGPGKEDGVGHLDETQKNRRQEMGEPDKKVGGSWWCTSRTNVSFSLHMVWEPTAYTSDGLPVTC